ncbi:hypothetical protein CBR_g16048 [Chara braunii]|uniref:Coiled-coil domain-containing protein 130 n=1 Tax=Chara braunii TaxID=69332 RepID=A0A388JSZ8_CHABU|nr:hypothetical protein CBR_g16048 [Chara braunii]|eukprot:GBG60926.1 hypothetical protein CBR_g16048 [Chara braunii]
MSSLAAARADNFYYPPEWTPNKGSLNKFQGKHALGDRAKKIGQGIIVIRFEMPFNVWCGGCSSMIAKGVRFNAEKKEVGKYLSSRIWSFKMKSACCKTEIEVQTDPKNAEYVVVSGAVRKVESYDAADAGTVELPDAEDHAKLRSDPFSKLEHTGLDKNKARDMAPALALLQRQSDLKHQDTYHLNRVLRAELRSQKKRVKAEEEEARSKGLRIRLLPPSQDDAKAAALMSYGKPGGAYDETQRKRRALIHASSIFSSGMASTSPAASGGSSVSKRPSSTGSGSGLGSSGKASGSRDRHTAELVLKRERMDVVGASRLVVGRVTPSSAAKEVGGSGASSLAGRRPFLPAAAEGRTWGGGASKVDSEESTNVHVVARGGGGGGGGSSNLKVDGEDSTNDNKRATVDMLLNRVSVSLPSPQAHPTPSSRPLGPPIGLWYAFNFLQSRGKDQMNSNSLGTCQCLHMQEPRHGTRKSDDKELV